MKRSVAARFLTLSVLALTLVGPQSVLAHCDGMDGSVVKAAQRALAKGGDESANSIRGLFQKVTAAKQFNAEDVSAEAD